MGYVCVCVCNDWGIAVKQRIKTLLLYLCGTFIRKVVVLLL